MIPTAAAQADAVRILADTSSTADERTAARHLIHCAEHQHHVRPYMVNALRGYFTRLYQQDRWGK